MLQYARHTAVLIKCLIACKDQIIDHVSSQPEFVRRNDFNRNDEESFHVNQTNDIFSETLFRYLSHSGLSLSLSGGKEGKPGI